MIIKICCDSVTLLNIKSIIDPLNDLGHSVLTDDEIIRIDGKNINVTAFESIKKKDPKNDFILSFKKELIKIQMKKIDEADCLLIVNNSYDEIGSNIFFQMAYAYFLKKPIYTTTGVNKNSIFFEEIHSMGSVNIFNDYKQIQHFTKVVEMKDLIPEDGRLKLKKKGE